MSSSHQNSHIFLDALIMHRFWQGIKPSASDQAKATCATVLSYLLANCCIVSLSKISLVLEDSKLPIKSHLPYNNQPLPFLKISHTLAMTKGTHNSFYFSEEISLQEHHKKSIVVSDRATLFNLLIGLDGYTIATGILNSNLNGNNIVSIPP